jgi:hypothetical protein
VYHASPGPRTSHYFFARGPGSIPYSPNVVEEEFSEVRIRDPG